MNDGPGRFEHARLDALAAVFRCNPRSRDAGGEALELQVSVDGVPIAASMQGRLLRLRCVVAPTLPDDGALRSLLQRYMRHAADGAETLCIDAEGRLTLITDIMPEEDIRRSAAQFCDCAVHWHGVCRIVPGQRHVAPPTAMIFP